VATIPLTLAPFGSVNNSCSLLNWDDCFCCFKPRQSRFPPACYQSQVNVASFRGSRRLIRGAKRKELPFTAKLDACVPFFCVLPLAIDRVRLSENGTLPESDICLRKVAKILHFLAIFSVHLWHFLTCHELVRRSL
jgi:hypothetical protein